MRALRLWSAREELFTGAAFSLKENGNIALSHIRNDIEKLLHLVIAADHILKAEFFADFAVQSLELRQIAEGFHPADNLTFKIEEYRGIDGNGNFAVVCIQDGYFAVVDIFTVGNGVAQRAVVKTRIGAKDFTTGLPQSLRARKPGDIFRSTVEQSDAHIVIHSKHPVGYAVQNGLQVLQICVHLMFFPHVRILSLSPENRSQSSAPGISRCAGAGSSGANQASVAKLLSVI